VGFVATPDLFFGFRALFFAEVVRDQGRLFLASGFDGHLYESWKAEGLSDQHVQKLLNHVHVGTLFQNQAMSADLAVAAGSALAEIWQRGFRGAVRVEWGGTDLSDLYVTFF